MKKTAADTVGMSAITNMAAGVPDQPLTTDEVDETACMLEDRFSAYTRNIISEI